MVYLYKQIMMREVLRMKEVFISHSSKEQARAVDICKVLEKNMITCWIAPRNVIGGMPYAEEIVRAIKNCKIVLLIASASINDSEQIMNEIEIAVNHSKIILPFKIDEVEYNDSYKYYLNRKHWIEALPNPQDFYSLLIEEVKYLLLHEDIDPNTINNTYLQALKERNRQELIAKTQDIRLSFGLSIKNDEYFDDSHFYEYLKRIDVLEDSGQYSSFRWLTVKNVSDSSTYYIIHKECGENKVYFKDMRVRAKQIFPDSSERIVIDSLIDIQPNFVQVFKLHFAKPLNPGETARIYYRLDWPNEVNSYYKGELSQSISLTRYKKGTGKLIFGVLKDSVIYDFELHGINNNFERMKQLKIAPNIYRADDDPELKPIHGKGFSGVYYEIEDAADSAAYRILYKQAAPQKIDNDDEEDF